MGALSLMDSASLDQTATSTTRCCHIQQDCPCLRLWLVLILHMFHPIIRGSHQRQAALAQRLCLMISLMSRRKCQGLRNRNKCRTCHHITTIMIHDHSNENHQQYGLTSPPNSQASKDLSALFFVNFFGGRGMEVESVSFSFFYFG